jgi:hypothetical protein
MGPLSGGEIVLYIAGVVIVGWVIIGFIRKIINR